MTEISDEFEKSLEVLKTAYKTKLKSEIPYYKNALNSEFKTDFIEDLRLHVHKLSGSAGIYGFNDLCNFTHEVDIFLQEILKNNPENSENVIKAKISGIINILEII